MAGDRKNVTILDVSSGAGTGGVEHSGESSYRRLRRLARARPHALDALELPREAPVVTVCAAGKTSLIAADLLRSRGHTVYSLVRGMKGWSAAWNTAEVAISPPHHGVRVIQVRRTGKGCLSYLLGAGSEATVIDASVGIEVYQKIAQGWGGGSRAWSKRTCTPTTSRVPASWQRQPVPLSWCPSRSGSGLRT